MEHMEIVKLDPTLDSVKDIIKDIDDLMNSLYPQESNQLLPIDELKKSNVYFIGVMKNNDILGCGAIVSQNNDGLYGELKRIYVKPKYRGQGVSKIIMQQLIAHAKDSQLPIIRLEAGIKQPEALTLYSKLGFKERNEFGNYKYDPLSIYMELKLCA
jgi:putative acetyltransferase